MRALELVIVSPSPAARRLLELLLGQLGHKGRGVEDGDAALARLASGRAGGIVVDVRACDEDSLLLLGLLQRRHPEIPRITLQNEELHIFVGDTHRRMPFGAGLGSAGFPSLRALEEATAFLGVESQLLAFAPKLALA